MILSHDDETIIAQCTPKGTGALALLRITGVNAIEIASKISKLPSNARLSDLLSHTIHFGYVVDSEFNHIDQVMFLLMRGPKTFTGQDTVEITCHNNPFIIQNIITQAIMHGARSALEGEFTKRAMLNNKIDLIQAEAINELIHANSQATLKKSLAQLEGSFSHWVITLEKELIKALAYSESSFEFIDEEMSFGDDIKKMLINTLGTIDSIKKTFDQQQQIRQGVRVAIIGSVNAGKSSLFNILLNKDRAIVTNIAGTTRDTLEAGVYKNSAYWTLIDTAGLRQTDDMIEQEGIKRSRAEAHQADVILLVFDASREQTAQEVAVYQDLLNQYGHKIISVYNKADVISDPLHPSIHFSLPRKTLRTSGERDQNINLYSPSSLGSLEQAQNQTFAPVHPECFAKQNVTRDINILISTKTKLNIDIIEQHIEEKISALFSSIDTPFLLNQRHYNSLLVLEKKLQELIAMIKGPSIAYELVSYHLNDALAQLSELTGKSISEQGMDAVFKEFCIGK